jgi:hypothetical protein
MNFEDKGSHEGRTNMQESSASVSKIVRRSNNRVKPKFFKLLGQIMNNHMEVKFR